MMRLAYARIERAGHGAIVSRELEVAGREVQARALPCNNFERTKRTHAKSLIGEAHARTVKAQVARRRTRSFVAAQDGYQPMRNYADGVLIPWR